MKYELEPDNRNCLDDELLIDLRKVAEQLGCQSITKEQYDQHGRFCSATMRNRFGSWNKALFLSGLIVKKRVDIPQEELLIDLKRVASELGMQTVTREQYRQYGNFSGDTVVRKYNSWAAALRVANLQSTGWKPPATEEDLFDNMASVWEHVGRQPKQKDFRPPISRYSDTTYINHYGSWRAALEAFVASANMDQNEADKEDHVISSLPVVLSEKEYLHRTVRNPSFRLR
jgi:hypothetical protein